MDTKQSTHFEDGTGMNNDLDRRLAKLELEVHVLRKLIQTMKSFLLIGEDQFRKIEAESRCDSNTPVPK